MDIEINEITGLKKLFIYCKDNKIISRNMTLKLFLKDCLDKKLISKQIYNNYKKTNKKTKKL